MLRVLGHDVNDDIWELKIIKTHWTKNATTVHVELPKCNIIKLKEETDEKL
jgi:hypothetical protein